MALSICAGDQPVALDPLILPPEHGALARLIERCLDFDPDLRPSASELAAALEAMLGQS